MVSNLFRVVCRENRNHNVVKLVLEAPEPLQLKPLCHVMIHNDLGDRKPYSPIRFDGRTLEFAIKVYPGGKVSPYLGGRREGDEVKVETMPTRREYKLNEHRSVLMLCGGTGVTPAFQILSRALSTAENKTGFTLLFFNSTEKDVFLRDELDALLQRGDPARLAIKYVCTSETQGKDARNDIRLVGKIVEREVVDAIKTNHFDFVYTCGPPGFMDVVSGNKTPDIKQGELTGILKELGFTSDSVYKF